jgi:hypothetical protein
VFLNRGNGTFSPPVRHLGGGESIRASDLDGDADLDLVSAGLNYFSVLLNKGNGTFERAMNFPAGQSLLSISVPDIDGDGFPDLAGAGEEPGVLLLRNQTGPPRSQDLNRNDVCDECEGILFHRGDPSGDARLGLSDPITLINYLFGAGNLPPCRETADVDNDGSIDLSDGIQLFSYLYLGGPPPANPGAPGAPCGPDPDPPGSAEDLGCWVYDSCDE